MLAGDAYFTWTGRYVTTAITSLVTGRWRAWTVPGFDLINALGFVALVGQVLRMARHVLGGDATRPRSNAWQFATWLWVALMLWWLPRSIAEGAL